MEVHEKKRKPIKLPTKSPHVAYFLSTLESFQKHDDLNEVTKNRISKACDLMDAGIRLFPNTFEKKHSLAWIKENFEDKSAEELEGIQPIEGITGRILALRSFGKAAFMTIQDQTGRIQCYVSRDTLGDEEYKNVKKYDIGDIIGVAGSLFRTKTGELTISCTQAMLITRAIRSLPEKYHGLKDMETRYRQRYVDLIVTPRTREIFLKRSLIVREFRNFMEDHGFMEVETPMMQSIAGGAQAKPFTTHHNALDMDLFMRIAPELYLKRLLVGGFEKIFELNRNFRNEGIDTKHNPEFTTCEFYWAYANFYQLMDLTEELFAYLARKVLGST
ncbi:MAG: lysine--tRNA ligase, partial [Desulfovibrio sp.]|nr:lysine--tRNA ligase [Desulfovibrio sp.]